MPPSYIERKRSGLGCFAKGCIGIAILIALGFISLWGFGLYIQRSFGPFFSESEVALRANDTTNEQFQAAMRKLSPLLMETPGQTPAPITITADDLNALVAHDHRLASAKDKCYFTIPGNQLAVDVSTQLSDKTTRSSRVVYFNARLTGDVNVSSGAVRIEPRKIESLNGSPFPDWAKNNRFFDGAVDEFNRNINQSIHNNTDLSDIVAKIASIKIENGHIVITPTVPAAAPGEGGTPVATPGAR